MNAHTRVYNIFMYEERCQYSNVARAWWQYFVSFWAKNKPLKDQGHIV